MSRPAPGGFINASLLEKTAGTGTVTFDATLTSTGIVTATSGTLQLNGGGTLDGAIGGIVHGGGSTLSNAGLIAKTGGALTSNIGMGFTNTGTVDVVSGTLRLGGGVGGTGRLQVEAGRTLELASGTFAGGNTIDLNGAGATLKIDTNAIVGKPIIGLGAGSRIDFAAASSATAVINGNTLTVTPASGSTPPLPIVPAESLQVEAAPGVVTPPSWLATTIQSQQTEIAQLN